MSIESDLVADLLAYAPLAALVGTRLAPDKVVQGAPRPYVVYIVEREPQYFLDGALASTLYRFLFQAWADERDECEQLADELEAALAASSALEPTGLQIESREVIAERDLELEGSELVVEAWIDP